MDTSPTTKTILIFLLFLLLESHNLAGSTKTESSLGNRGEVQRVSSIKIGKSNRTSLNRNFYSTPSSKGRTSEVPIFEELTTRFASTTRPTLSSSMTSTHVPLSWSTGTPYPSSLHDNGNDDFANFTEQLKVSQHDFEYDMFSKEVRFLIFKIAIGSGRTCIDHDGLDCTY
ncbi:hypothetical protein QAD02_012131 [Eretmocerus hayati]|uniref:Uncharacterized protein n=1 Tax=Eretmocerus hayati TaxID=131215 RepID=A0ACC2NYH1_9HYME|nr:hypothetical protein QAD02_012131 [Eretmocerus hayati]